MFLPTLHKAVCRAIQHGAYGSAHTLLDLALSYAYPRDLPKEARSLWEAKLCLRRMMSLMEHPDEWDNPTELYDQTNKELQAWLQIQVPN